MQALEGFIIDVTVQKEAKDTLEESEEKYRSLIEKSNDAFFLIYQGQFEIINEKFKELYAITLDELNHPDFDLLTLFAPESRPIFKKRFESLMSGKVPGPRFEFTAMSKQGQKIEIEASIGYIKYKQGIAVQGFLRDISERKHLEQQLIQSQKMESIGTLANCRDTGA